MNQTGNGMGSFQGKLMKPALQLNLSNPAATASGMSPSTGSAKDAFF